MRFIIMRPEVQALAENGWSRRWNHAAIMDVVVFDRHQEFEQFDHLREVAFILKLHAEKRVTCDKLRVTNQNL